MLVSFIHEDPVASENLMFFSLLSIDCRPRLKYVDVFMDLVLHRPLGIGFRTYGL